MKNVKKTVDANAHLLNICSVIEVREGTPYVRITAENGTEKTIVAVKFKAVGYNSFNEIILVEGKNNFEILLQDLLIESNNIFSVYAEIPDRDIREIDLTELQVRYLDGSIDLYEENTREIELQEYEDTGREGIVLEALKAKFGSRFRYKPKEDRDIWICGCGRVNKIDSLECSYCCNMREEVFNNTVAEKEEGLIKEYEELKKIEASKKLKKQCIMVGVILVASIIIGVTGWFIKKEIDFSKRKTFTTADDMQMAVQGIWGHENARTGGPFPPYFVVEGNKGMKVLGANLCFEDDITWNPASGTFECDGYTFVVGKDGTIWEEGNPKDKYKMKTYMDVNEDGYEVLKVSNVSVSTNNGSYFEGTITNNGLRTYTQVTIFVAIKDKSGNVLYANELPIDKEINPGETISFKEEIGNRWNVIQHDTCSINIYSFKYKGDYK